MADRYRFVPATREQVEAIRKQLGTNEDDIRRAIASLRDWLRKQPLLPDHIDNGLIERMYINCKCSTERVKRGLDAYFSLRTRYPETLLNRDPAGSDIEQTMRHLKLVLMPRLTKELYRVHIITDVDPDPKWVSWPSYAKIASILLDTLYFDDYSLGDVVIFDHKNVHIGHLVRSDVNIIHLMELAYKTAWCRRIKAYHLVNVDKTIDIVMKIMKAAFSEKLHKRIHVHPQGSTTLFDHVSREDLPDELGGTAGPVDKLAYSYEEARIFCAVYVDNVVGENTARNYCYHDFIRRAKEKRDWFLEQDKYTSDESKRPPDNHHADDMYGVAGSFKKLTVD